MSLKRIYPPQIAACDVIEPCSNVIGPVVSMHSQSSQAPQLRVAACHRSVKHPPKTLVQSSRCVKDRAMRPGGASLSHPCGWPLGVGFIAVPSKGAWR